MRKPRGSETSADMVRSVALVGIFTLGVLLLGSSRQLIFPREETAQRVRVVDYANEVAAARRAAADVLAPTGLPAGWRATSVRYTNRPNGLVLHIGFLTPAEKYAEVGETTGDGAAFLVDRLQKGSTAVGTVRVDGRAWQQRRTGKGESALVGINGRATVVVTGSADQAELQTLVASLD